MMNKYLTILCLVLYPLIVFSESDKPQFTEEQLAQIKAAEEEYKGAPAPRNTCTGSSRRTLKLFPESIGLTSR